VSGRASHWFTVPATKECFPEAGWAKHSSAHVAELRTTYSLQGGDADVREKLEHLASIGNQQSDASTLP
jgi:hypothetical protein